MVTLHQSRCLRLSRLNFIASVSNQCFVFPYHGNICHQGYVFGGTHITGENISRGNTDITDNGEKFDLDGLAQAFKFPYSQRGSLHVNGKSKRTHVFSTSRVNIAFSQSRPMVTYQGRIRSMPKENLYPFSDPTLVNISQQHIQGVCLSLLFCRSRIQLLSHLTEHPWQLQQVPVGRLANEVVYQI